jgi:hypothetical protein
MEHQMPCNLLVAIGVVLMSQSNYATSIDVKVAASILRSTDHGASRVRLRVLNNSKHDVIMKVPMLCSYSFSLIHDGERVVSADNPPQVSVPFEMRQGEANCGASSEGSQYLNAPVRIHIPAGAA